MFRLSGGQCLGFMVAGEIPPQRNAHVALLFAAGAAAFHAVAAGFRTGGADFIIGKLLARLGAGLTGLGASLATNAHEGPLPSAYGHAGFAKLGTIQASGHACGVFLGLGFDLGRAMRVAFEAIGDALGTIDPTLLAAILAIGFLVLRQEPGTGAQDTDTGGNSSQNLATIHDFLRESGGPHIPVLNRSKPFPISTLARFESMGRKAVLVSSSPLGKSLLRMGGV